MRRPTRQLVSTTTDDLRSWGKWTIRNWRGRTSVTIDAASPLPGKIIERFREFSLKMWWTFHKFSQSSRSAWAHRKTARGCQKRIYNIIRKFVRKKSPKMATNIEYWKKYIGFIMRFFGEKILWLFWKLYTKIWRLYIKKDEQQYICHRGEDLTAKQALSVGKRMGHDGGSIRARIAWDVNKISTFNWQEPKRSMSITKFTEENSDLDPTQMVWSPSFLSAISVEDMFTKEDNYFYFVQFYTLICRRTHVSYREILLQGPYFQTVIDLYSELAKMARTEERSSWQAGAVVNVRLMSDLCQRSCSSHSSRFQKIQPIFEVWYCLDRSYWQFL